jgi:hypothetical protein
VRVISRSTIRKLIAEELVRLDECACKAAADDPRNLIPNFDVSKYETHPHFKMITDYELSREMNALDSKCPGSYAKTADQLVINPEFVASIIDLLMKKSGSTCPESSAKALQDIIMLYEM